MSGQEVAAGTPCVPCKAKGHYCSAQEMEQGQAVCYYCLDGVACPKQPRGQRDNHLPDPKQATRAVAVHEAAIAKPAAAAASATMPQPALAAGAEPSPAMPPRRKFLQAATASSRAETPALCTRGCGGAPHRGNCRGAGLVVTVGAMAKAAETSRSAMKAAAARVPAVAPRHEGAPALSPKCVADGYRVIALADMPGRKYNGVYDEVAAEFMKLPKGSVLTKTFANRAIAHTYMLAMVRIGRKRGLKMRQKQDDNTIYVWQV